MMNNYHEEGPQNVSAPPPTPGGYSNPDQHSFLLQCTLDMKASVGKLEGSVESLTATIKDQSEKLDKLRIRFAYAAAIFLTVTMIGGFVVDKMWDVAKPLINDEVAKISNGQKTNIPAIPVQKKK